MVIEVEGTDEFKAWYEGLSDGEADTVDVCVTRLEMEGVSLGFPHCSEIKGARYGIRELRPKRGKSPLRVFYAFDPRRMAMLLIGGDKSNDKKFYERMARQAETIWEEFLEELAEEEKSSR